jgi:hypothetical protein
MDTEVAELDVTPPVKKARKGKKAKKRGAKARRDKRNSSRSMFARGRTATTALVLGAGVAIGGALGAILGRRR